MFLLTREIKKKMISIYNQVFIKFVLCLRHVISFTVNINITFGGKAQEVDGLAAVNPPQEKICERKLLERVFKDIKTKKKERKY